MSTAMLDSALSYANRGWSIIPIRHRPGTGGKQPAIPSWKAYQTRRATEAELRVWFDGAHRNDGLAVVLGGVSGGLLCRDFDRLDAYDRWAAGYPKLATELPTVETARGRHVYARADVQTYRDLGDGELRGDSGHYCLLPPSRHSLGHVYRWTIPLPDGELPTVNPLSTGLADVTEHTEAVCSVCSACSVTDDGPEAELENIIRATLPTATGQRNNAIFALARRLKAIPDLTNAPAQQLRDVLRRWHKAAMPIIGTKDFDSSWSDFLSAWPRVKFPGGDAALEAAIQLAEQSPPPAVAERYDTPETRRLVAICAALQHLHGNAPFFLAARTAARLIGVDHMTASRRLRMLLDDGVLRLVHRGTERRAARFRFTGGDP